MLFNRQQTEVTPKLNTSLWLLILDHLEEQQNHQHLVKSDEWLEPVWTTEPIMGLSQASPRTTASPTTEAPSAAQDGPIQAPTLPSRLLLGDLTEAELIHVVQCSECWGLWGKSKSAFKMHAQAVAGTTSTYQRPEFITYAASSGRAESPSSDSNSG